MFESFKKYLLNPEKYSITKIISDPDSDLAMNLDFEINVGMSRQEAIELNNKCIKMAEETFESIKLWGVMPREHFLLYLDRYGKDPLTGNKPNLGEEEKMLCKA